MDGTLILWDLYNGQSLQKWTLAASNGITAVAWCLVHKDQPTDTFIIGTSAGSVAAYRKVQVLFFSISFLCFLLIHGAQLNYDYVNSTQAFIGPVEDIAFDNHHNRLAIVGDGRLKLYNCTETRKSSTFHSTGLNDYSTPTDTLGLLHETVPRNDIARNACFYANGSSVFVTYLESQHLQVNDLLCHSLLTSYYVELATPSRPGPSSLTETLTPECTSRYPAPFLAFKSIASEAMRP